MGTDAGKKAYIEDINAGIVALTATVDDNTADIGQISGGLGVLAIAASVLNDGSTGVNPSTPTKIEFSDPADVEFDDYGYHSTSSNPDRFTIPSGKGGIHVFEATVTFPADATGTYRALWIIKNGTTRIGRCRLPVGSAAMDLQVRTGPKQMSATDYVWLEVEHDASGLMAIDGSGGFPVTFSAYRQGT